MGLVFATTAGLVIWIVLWSLGYSGLDSGLLALAVMILGAGGDGEHESHAPAILWQRARPAASAREQAALARHRSVQ